MILELPKQIAAQGIALSGDLFLPIVKTIAH
jgi:hypothetical protein